ncbi:hypothetical protein REPUB_Repub06bG0095900 [Reevesia pubescens]
MNKVMTWQQLQIHPMKSSEEPQLVLTPSMTFACILIHAEHLKKITAPTDKITDLDHSTGTRENNFISTQSFFQDIQNPLGTSNNTDTSPHELDSSGPHPTIFRNLEQSPIGPLDSIAIAHL